MSATWTDGQPAGTAPATVRRVVAEITVAVLIAGVLLAAFLIGQSKQDRWCAAHPVAAQTSESCPNPTPGGTR